MRLQKKVIHAKIMSTAAKRHQGIQESIEAGLAKLYQEIADLNLAKTLRQTLLYFALVTSFKSSIKKAVFLLSPLNYD
jgi:hypothetical protein